MATVATRDGDSKLVEVRRLHFGALAPNRPTESTEVRARMNEAAPDPAR
jgi:hypothetical protein